MDLAKVDQVVQYALAVASEAEGRGERELGPIHLLKFAYLADMEHARWTGASFTQTAWRFHKFGPWSPEVFQRLPVAMQAVGAVERRFPSQYSEEDAIRWHLDRGSAIASLEGILPGVVTGAIRRAVQKFGNDTTYLLQEVYKTPPMLSAAPGELLNLAIGEPQEPAADVPGGLPASLPVLSKTKVKALKARIDQRRAAGAGRSDRVAPQPAPRYDDLFFEGTRWLDELAGSTMSDEKGQLHFADSVWKSRARREPEIL